MNQLDKLNYKFTVLRRCVREKNGRYQYPSPYSLLQSKIIAY